MTLFTIFLHAMSQFISMFHIFSVATMFDDFSQSFYSLFINS